MATAFIGRPEARVPPHDLEAETSVLGAVLLDQAAITRVLDFLHPEDFYRENNGHIYRAAQSLFREGEPIDNVTLAAELEKLGVLERVGGRAHLAMLQESVPTAANVEYYARIVKDRAYKRRLITAGSQVTALGYEDALDAEEAVNQAQSHVYSISDDRVGGGMERLYDLLKPAMDRIDAQMASGGGVIGIGSGFHDLDRMTNGYKPSDLIVIAGRPSMGKALALDTPIPTPAGWTTMGRLRVGDQVFDDQGRPCTVTFATPVQVGRECFEVVFSDGERIVADADHLWSVFDPGRLRRLVTTREMAASARESGRSGYSVPACGPLRYAESELPVDPYELGVCLGAGHVAGSYAGPGGSGGAAHLPQLEEIPPEYVEASVEQRTALLQGLMDSRGRAAGSGQAEFRSADPRMARAVHELARGLGLVSWLQAAPDPRPGVDDLAGYGVRFRPNDVPVFRRSGERGGLQAAPLNPAEAQRDVVDVRPTDSVPVRCIQVDSPSHLYLAGRACIPTHNTSFVLNVALHAAVEQKKPVAIFSLEMSKEQLVERMLCEQARIDAQRLHRGLLSDVEYERLAGALGPLGDAPVYIDDSPMLDDLTLRLKARQARTREGIEMIVLDYLQLMHGRSRSDDGNRVQEVSAISRALKSIARELKVPVIAISQLSRAPEARPDKRPILSDLRESGCLTADTRLLRADNGRTVSFAELLERGWEDVLVWSVDEDRRLQPAPLQRVFASGVKPVFRLRLAGGAEVKASANHRFLARTGWRQLRRLRLGESIAVTRDVPALVAASGSPPGWIGQDAAPGGPYSAPASAVLVQPQVTDDVLWDRVAAVEPLGEQPVYDATVAGTHSFIANGIVAHNSIEQDADIVMFLYRDDYYNREKSEKPGIAEVIVAKHRNGPTGTVELVFRKELTRFENLERRRPEPSPSGV